MTVALEGGEWSAARPGRTLPPGKTRYPLYRRLGGSQGRSGQVENLAHTGIRSLDRPDRSQSLYRLSYQAHKHPACTCVIKNEQDAKPTSASSGFFITQGYRDARSRKCEK